MHKIKTSHEPRKRTFDSMFRALICAGLNRQKLLLWVRLVIRCPELVEDHYERWSLLARTGRHPPFDLSFFCLIPRTTIVSHITFEDPSQPFDTSSKLKVVLVDM